MSCQRCGSSRVADVGAKCDDRCLYLYGEREQDGYVPSDAGIGVGDYVRLSYCLECGQIQGDWPVQDPFSPCADEDEARCICGAILDGDGLCVDFCMPDA